MHYQKWVDITNWLAAFLTGLALGSAGTLWALKEGGML